MNTVPVALTMNKKIQNLIDRYEAARDRRLPRLLDFWQGRIPYLVSIEAGFTRYASCGSIEENFQANLYDFEKTLECPSDTLPNLEPWFGTGVLAEVFGCAYYWRQGDAPAVHYAYHTLDEIRDIPKPDLSAGKVAALILDAIAYFKEKTGGQLPMCLTDTQSAGDNATLILDASEFFIACYTDPDIVRRFLGVINDLIIEFSQKQAEAIGDCLVLPGRIIAASLPAAQGGTGITIADDNLAVASPQINADFFLPLDDQIGQAFGGAAIHSCGNWGHTIPLLRQWKNLTMIECKISSPMDPSPTPPEQIRDALRGTDIAVQVTLNNDVERDFDLLDRLAAPGLRLIVRFLNDGTGDIQSRYDLVNRRLQKIYG